jgi:tetratricopeptide (TPR) repeat protein
MIFSSCGIFAPGEDAYLKHYTKAHEYFTQNQPEKAIPLYKKALNSKENFAQGYHELAICYQQIGEADSAIVYYMGAIVHNPKNVDAYQSIGNLYYIQGNADDALIWYDRGSEVDYLYPKTYQNMATIWYQRGNFKMARKYFNQAIAVDATYPRAYYGLGLLAFLEKDYNEAEAKFTDAFKVGSMPEAIYMLAELYFEKGEKEKAYVWYRKYVDRVPDGEFSQKAKDQMFLLEQELPIDEG